ncbi:alpha/beta hydrolase [Streptomyces sp. Ru73]|uniref:alpha/beta hydrolase family protein n=1 Tax=Streptomyces sp. Ru73 TaxID=2080748 RepID=UPI000CDDCEFF|nr:alpha/beta fold hydrolase [Streptomyces sp. Ru73]POX38550.1 alpha/beta hydrolase [Streptomyces sp. Ru73]
MKRPRFPLLREITAPDGTRLTVRCLRADRAGAPVIVLFPAMGTPARSYAPLVRALHRQGMTVALCDLRGHGESTPVAARSVPCGYREIVEHDIGAVLGAVREEFPAPAPLFVLGHSLGGQLSLVHCGLYGPEADGVVLVASGSAWYRCFAPRERARWLVTGLAGGLAARLLGYWPGARLGLGAREGARLMRDWARQVRTGRYRAEGSRLDYEAALARVTLPVLAVDVAGDLLAPPRAVDHLCGKLRGAAVTRWHFAARTAQGDPAGHFRWVRHHDGLVERIAAWTAEVSRPVAAADRPAAPDPAQETVS